MIILLLIINYLIVFDFIKSEKLSLKELIIIGIPFIMLIGIIIAYVNILLETLLNYLSLHNRLK